MPALPFDRAETLDDLHFLPSLVFCKFYWYVPSYITMGNGDKWSRLFGFGADRLISWNSSKISLKKDFWCFNGSTGRFFWLDSTELLREKSILS